MKPKVLCSIVIVAATLVVNAQTVTLVATVGETGSPIAYSEVVTLAAGDVATVLTQLPAVSGASAVATIDGKEIELTPHRAIPAGPGLAPSSVPIGITLAGPAMIRARAYPQGAFGPVHGDKYIATVSITRANAVPTVTPQNAVVIPEDANGNFQVILESSTDLITWTAANPGTYSGSTQRRFFRTRIVKQ